MAKTDEVVDPNNRLRLNPHSAAGEYTFTLDHKTPSYKTYAVSFFEAYGKMCVERPELKGALIIHCVRTTMHIDTENHYNSGWRFIPVIVPKILRVRDSIDWERFEEVAGKENWEGKDKKKVKKYRAVPVAKTENDSTGWWRIEDKEGRTYFHTGSLAGQWKILKPSHKIEFYGYAHKSLAEIKAESLEEIFDGD